MSTSTATPVCCLLIDQEAEVLQHPFIAEVPSESYVQDLIKKVKEMNPCIEVDTLSAWQLHHFRSLESLRSASALKEFVEGISHHLSKERTDTIETVAQTRFLVDADQISELGDLPKKSLHIIVQVSDLSRGKKRHHSPSSDLEKTKRRKMPPHAIVDFHSKIWNKKSDTHSTVFVTTSVERPQLAGVNVPSQCCVMRSPPYGSASLDLSGIFIRNEFFLALEGIVALYKDEDPAKNPKGNEDEATGHEDETRFPVAFTNPFLAPDFPLRRGQIRGVIVTGAPGIGKSLLLEVILHLRNLAGRSTIFIRDTKRIDLFNSNGVSRLGWSEVTESELPPSVWALVDSNTDLTGVPDWVRSFDCFIVQAASPRPSNLHWRMKQIGVSLYIMKMWSLEEILAARMVQKTKLPSEAELKTFFEHYVPSARTAYNFASHIELFESELRRDIGSLSVEGVIKILDDLAALQTDAQLPHRLFSIQPGETRSSVVINLTSRYIADKLVAALKEKVANATRVLFEITNRNPSTKAFAGYLLDAVIRDVFTRGAVWPIHQMQVSPNKGKVNQHWKITSSKSYAGQYLIVGHPAESIIKICDEHPGDDIDLELFPCFPFGTNTDQVTTTGYYIPQSKNEATFDAFYYDADRKEATVLQATVDATHSVNVKGIRRLQEVGVQSARYVAVTGPQEEFDLSVPKEYDGVFVKEKYHLVLPKVN